MQVYFFHLFQRQEKIKVELDRIVICKFLTAVVTYLPNFYCLCLKK